MIVVRINDRGPYGNDRVISLSRASADRLNTSNNTKVRIDPIIVAPDGSLSGPGMACTTVAKQTYALPARPNLDGGDATGMSQPAPTDVRPISNSTLKPEDSVGAPVNSGGFLGARRRLTAACWKVANRRLQRQLPAQPLQRRSPHRDLFKVALPRSGRRRRCASSSATSSASGNFVVQVGRSERPGAGAAVSAAPEPAVLRAGARHAKRRGMAYSAGPVCG